jgi:hypothetical protein
MTKAQREYLREVLHETEDALKESSDNQLLHEAVFRLSLYIVYSGHVGHARSQLAQRGIEGYYPSQPKPPAPYEKKDSIQDAPE